MPVRRRCRVLGPALAAAVCVAAFAVGAGVRMPCRDACASDIGRLYEMRSVDGAHLPFLDRPLEYPPLIGEVMYAAGLPGDGSPRTSFLVNALLLTSLAALVTWRLWSVYGRRALRWLFAPPLLLEGLINWDLLAVAPATLGLVLWVRGGAFWAGALLGLGTAAKVFPGLYVLLLAAACVPTADWRRARRLVSGALLAVAVTCLPVQLIASDAIPHFFAFQGARVPTRGTVWFYLARDATLRVLVDDVTLSKIANVVAVVLTALVLVVLVRRVAAGKLDPLAACGLVTIAFLVTNKVYSPQYDLWLVPFLVMLRIPRRHVVHFFASSTTVFAMSYGFSHVIPNPMFQDLNGIAVAYRLVALAMITCDLLRRDRPVPSPAHAPTRGRGASVSCATR